MAFAINDYTVEDATGLNRIVSVFRIYGPVIKGSLNFLANTINVGNLVASAAGMPLLINDFSANWVENTGD